MGIEFDHKGMITGLSGTPDTSSPDEINEWKKTFRGWDYEDAANPIPQQRDILEEFLKKIKVSLRFREIVEKTTGATVVFKK